MLPLRKPRTEFALQPVISTSSFKVTPSGRFKRARIFAVLLPPWVALAGLFALAVRWGLPGCGGATVARGLPTRGFFVGTLVAFVVFFLEVVIAVPFRGSLPRDDIHH